MTEQEKEEKLDDWNEERKQLNVDKLRRKESVFLEIAGIIYIKNNLVMDNCVRD